MNAGWQVPSHTCELFRAKSSKYALIVPVLNEGERIRRQAVKLAPFANQVDAFLVDGGSTDGAVTSELLKRNGFRGYLAMPRPLGLSAQLRIGLAQAIEDGYEGIILIDGNDKDGVEGITRFIDALEKGFDHIQGSRFVPGGKAIHNPWKRILAIRCIHAPLISMAAGVRYTDTTNGFRAYSRRFLTDPRVQPFREVFTKYELHYYLAIRAGRLGFRVTEVPVERRYPAGEAPPTKIKGIKGEIKVMRTLLDACRHRFDPKLESPK